MRLILGMTIGRTKRLPPKFRGGEPSVPYRVPFQFPPQRNRPSLHPPGVNARRVTSSVPRTGCVWPTLELPVRRALFRSGPDGTETKRGNRDIEV